MVDMNDAGRPDPAQKLVLLGRVTGAFGVRGERERLLPFVQPDYVKAVDFEAGTVTVDWDPEF